MLHAEELERRGPAATESRRRKIGQPLEELARVGHQMVAETLQISLVRLERGYRAIERVGDVDGMRRLAGAADRDVADAVPRLLLDVAEDPPVAGVGHGV